MKQRIFVYATDRCFGCGGCIAACVARSATPPGLFRRQVLKLPPEVGDHHTLYLSLACNHCVDAPCVRACPSRALVKRPQDGVVLHREDRCIGCRYCQMACPYDAIRWDEGRRIISKCDFCVDRLDRGRAPACVEACFAGALEHRVLDTEDEPAGCHKEAPGFSHLDEARPGIRFLHAGTEKRLSRTRPFPPARPGVQGNAAEEP